MIRAIAWAIVLVAVAGALLILTLGAAHKPLLVVAAVLVVGIALAIVTTPQGTGPR